MTTTRLFIAASTVLTLATASWMGAVDARAAQEKTAQEKPAQEKAASEGVYTTEQATRGLTLYDTSCASCHELGKFKGTEFSSIWGDKPLTDLHAAVLSMPMDAPGSMKPQEYADIIAYFLSINGYPAGKVELAGTDAAIKAIKLDVKKQ